MHDVVLGGGSTLSKDRCEELNTDFVRNSQGPFERCDSGIDNICHNHRVKLFLNTVCTSQAFFFARVRGECALAISTETHKKSKTIECHGISVRAGRDHAATADQGRAILKCRIFLLGVAPLPMDERAMMQDHRSFLI